MITMPAPSISRLGVITQRTTVGSLFMSVTSSPSPEGNLHRQVSICRAVFFSDLSTLNVPGKTAEEKLEYLAKQALQDLAEEAISGGSVDVERLHG